MFNPIKQNQAITSQLNNYQINTNIKQVLTPQPAPTPTFALNHYNPTATTCIK